jgi:minor capsid protein
MSGSLEHSAAQVIRSLLVSLGGGTMPITSGSWPISVGAELDTPDKAIAIYDETGIKHGRTMPDGEVQENHGIQVRIRSTNDKNGYKKARQLALLMDSVRQNTISLENVESAGTSSYRVTCISRVGDVISLGKEVGSSKRCLFTLNAVVPLRQIS